jgi:hypothetical protein
VVHIGQGGTWIKPGKGKLGGPCIETQEFFLFPFSALTEISNRSRQRLVEHRPADFAYLMILRTAAEYVYSHATFIGVRENDGGGRN